jgi:hypothetical protein
VVGRDGTPLAGVRVTFTPGANSGTVTDGTPLTNSEGVATVGGWQVGPNEGRQTLVATVAGLPPVTFVANVSDAEPCDGVAYTLLTTVQGSLRAGDCEFEDGSFVDFYRVTAGAAINHEFRMTSTAVDAFLWATDPMGRIIGVVDDAAPPSTDASLRLIAPPGTYIIGANSFDVGETGAYTFSSVNTPRAAGCIPNTFLQRGISFTEALSASDCERATGSGGPGVADEYGLILYPGQAATVTMLSTVFDTYLRATNGSQAFANDNGGGGTNARLLLSVPASGQATLFVINATSNLAGASGAYAIDVTSVTVPLMAEPAPAESPRAAMASLSRQVRAFRAGMAGEAGIAGVKR